MNIGRTKAGMNSVRNPKRNLGKNPRKNFGKSRKRKPVFRICNVLLKEILGRVPEGFDEVRPKEIPEGISSYFHERIPIKNLRAIPESILKEGGPLVFLEESLKKILGEVPE